MAAFLSEYSSEDLQLSRNTPTSIQESRSSRSQMNLALTTSLQHRFRSILVEEAIRTRTVPRVLRDLFVRELRQSLPQGWTCPLDDASRSEVAGALADWEAELQDHLVAALVFKAGQELLSAELPAGWLPTGPDDPVIIAFVNRCLGDAARAVGPPPPRAAPSPPDQESPTLNNSFIITVEMRRATGSGEKREYESTRLNLGR